MSQPQGSRTANWTTLIAGLVLVMLLGALVAAVFALLTLEEPGAAGQVTRLLWVAIFGVGAAAIFLAALLLSWREDLRLSLRRIADMRRQNDELRSRLGQHSDALTEMADERTQSTTILQSISEAVLVLNASRVRYANQAALRLFNAPPELLLNRSLRESDALSTDLAALYTRASKALARSSLWQGEDTLHTDDGQPVEVRAIGLPMQGSRQGDLLIIVRDNVPEKVQRQQEREFFNNASHELRTPLATIQTRLYLLRKQPEKLDENLEVLEKTVTYMQQLLNDMLDIGQLEQGLVLLRRERAVVQELVTEAVDANRPRAERRAIALKVDLIPDALEVFVDTKRMVQAFRSLVSSAMNHTPEGGTVHIRVFSHELPDGPHQAIIEVQNQGVSIPPKMLERSFRAFGDASTGEIVSGTVLGLSLTREIVALHGGALRAEDLSGAGTALIVGLPILETESPNGVPAGAEALRES